MQIHALWHYPVKGFGGSQLDKAALTAGGYFPNDRQFALSIGGDKTKNASPGTWFQKAHFLQLMSHEAMADYHCRFTRDAQPQRLMLFHHRNLCLSIDPAKPNDCRRFEDMFTDLFANKLCGRPRLMQMKEQAYSDQSTPLISIASTASLAAFANATGTKADSRRFRINIIISADNAFAETRFIGQKLRCGDALLLVKKPVGRCAAINVDPDTAQRNPNDYVRFMRAHFGHSNLGIFAEVINGGTIKPGDRLVPA